MKKKKVLSSIPDDLLIDIFFRVPSKSIARFRCVSKFWGSILQRPDFTELFLTRSYPRILFTLEVNKEILFFYSPQHPNPDDNNSCVVATRYDRSFPTCVPSTYHTIMLSGLVLCQGYGKGHRRRKVHESVTGMICNPATGEYINLPNVLLKDKASLSKVKPKIARICLGYDPINKQLKVLCMTESSTHQVLTLDKGKLLWRKIESEFDLFDSYEFAADEICINGVLYFVHFLKDSYSYGIVCFDVRSEKFSLISIDNDMVQRSMSLVNYKGKFGIHNRKMGEFIYDRGDNGFDLWVLEDAGNHKWSKQEHEYSHMWKRMLYEHGLYLIGMTCTGEMLFAQYGLSNPFYVFYYNFERKTFTRVNIQGFEEIKRGRSRNSSYRGRTYTGFSPRNYTRINTFMDYGENMKLFK